ncbi:hypothetical protein LSH36_781g00003 [Paralvinella palmiformis]|uniref:Uncharacterized protein n=1 Tax=Paralvinella palmiformis TaxID=53620 RepID=A0AAD9J071_9ANNE|nr:hypothetical protein LSH36_781g00003 [Paralvinella palmiformis]
MPARRQAINVRQADPNNVRDRANMDPSDGPNGLNEGVLMADHLLALRKKGYPSETQGYSELVNRKKHKGVVNKSYSNDDEDGKQTKTDKTRNKHVEKQHQQMTPDSRKRSKQVVGGKWK